jgi:hypothetical protein
MKAAITLFVATFSAILCAYWAIRWNDQRNAERLAMEQIAQDRDATVMRERAMLLNRLDIPRARRLEEPKRTAEILAEVKSLREKVQTELTTEKIPARIEARKSLVSRLDELISSITEGRDTR